MTLEEWAAEEQANLWGDLAEQLRRALNGHWSMGCESVAYRIVGAARLVGPTPWREVDWELVAGGVWSCLLGYAGVDFEFPTDIELDEADAVMRSVRERNRHQDMERFMKTRFAIADWWIRDKPDKP